MTRARQLIDLSHVVEHGMITYLGIPAPIICDYLSREASREIFAPGTEFHIGRIDMIANTGTYVDAPFHRYPDGKDLGALPLESVADLEAVVVRCVGLSVRSLDETLFRDIDVRGKAVLFHTGWDRHWRTDQYFDGHPYLTSGAALDLMAGGAALVGIDSLNIDDTTDMSRPVHSLLLGAGIPIAEHLCNLAALPDAGFRLSAVPVKVTNFGTFPVRAYAAVSS